MNGPREPRRGIFSWSGRECRTGLVWFRFRFRFKISVFQQDQNRAQCLRLGSLPASSSLKERSYSRGGGLQAGERFVDSEVVRWLQEDERGLIHEEAWEQLNINKASYLVIISKQYHQRTHLNPLTSKHAAYPENQLSLSWTSIRISQAKDATSIPKPHRFSSQPDAPRSRVYCSLTALFLLSLCQQFESLGACARSSCIANSAVFEQGGTGPISNRSCSISLLISLSRAAAKMPWHNYEAQLDLWRLRMIKMNLLG